MILSLLLSTFITIFIAELGDKTQLATLTMSGTSNKPLAVFLGSSTALVLASLVGALAGGSISNFVPEIILKSIASVTFFILGMKLFLNSFTSNENDNNKYIFSLRHFKGLHLNDFKFTTFDIYYNFHCRTR